MSRFVAPLPSSKHAERAHQPAIASSPPVLPPVLPVLPPRPPNTHQSSGSLNARPTPMLPPRPPPTPPTPETHSLHKPSESLQLDPLPVPQIVVDLDSGSPVLTPDEPVEYEEEKELSEQQLREMYDEEELDRFLHLFSAYVNEVRAPGELQATSQPAGSGLPLTPLAMEEQREMETKVAQEGGEWTPVHASDEPTPDLALPIPGSLREQIAMTIVMPLLPPPTAATSQSFTLSRLKIALQRLFLAIEPTYRPFLVDVYRLATWSNWNRSCLWCSVFWVLWLIDLILPALLGRILWSLVKRRLFPYPTLAQLRERRAEVERAEKFGDRISYRLASTSKFGVKDAWKIAKDFRSRSNVNLASKSKDPAPDESANEQNAKEERVKIAEEEWVLEDLQRILLRCVNEVADLHERVRNIFLWRKPTASKMYGVFILFLFVGTIVLPAQWIAKVVYFCFGFVFWHVTPVLACLPYDRIPPPLFNVPTDTDYAMDLIAQRVAAGLDVKPSVKSSRLRRRLLGKRRKSTLGSDADTVTTVDDDSTVAGDEPRSGDWVRGAVKAANVSKAWISDGLQYAKNIKENGLNSPTLTSPSSISVNVANAVEDEHPFLAQHLKSGPGIITLTSSTFTFTPAIIGTSSPRIVVPLQDLRAVKKTGALSVKGLALRRINERGEEVAERFLWVRGRDEAFARLVGVTDKRWMRI